MTQALSPHALGVPSGPAIAKALAFDEGQLRTFLSYIMDASAGATEMRVIGAAYSAANRIEVAQRFSQTLAGWYDSPDALAVDARKLKGVSAYVTLNPVNPALLARCYNRLAKAKHTTMDADIACLRWLFVDVDPVRPADISSTDGELAAAVERRDAILRDHPGMAGSSLWGRSGNGAWILVRLPDYPNDEAHRAMVADATARLAARYSDAIVSIDVKTKNPARIMCLPGTLKCKGSHVVNPGNSGASRPWRLATIDGAEGASL